jgi:hypothetical protein
MKGNKINFLSNIAMYLFYGLLIVHILSKDGITPYWLYLVPISLVLIEAGLNLFKKK